MGYEIKYYYKESTENPGVYKDEIVTKTSKVGKFEEEISLDILAGKIMAQLARRNILIVDIEIFEYAKKKISYKETESGILIKNKKFSFDSGAVIESESEEDEDLEKVLQNENLILKIKSALNIDSAGSNKKNIASKISQTPSRRMLRKEVYDPEIINKHKIEQRGYKFTVGKQYPIYSEKNVGMGVVNYLTLDDSGREVEVISDCFVAPSAGLSFQDSEPQYFGAENNSGEINLWKNVQVESSVPDIRRK